MNEIAKLQGLVSAIAIWVSLDRLIPRRLETPADIFVPVLVFLAGMTGAMAAWKGKIWGYWTLLVFAVLQIVALGVGGGYIGYGVFAKSRGVEFVMIVLLALGALSLILRTPRRQPNTKING
ncbi:MAG: hypothetical protein JJU29_12090 [Verrucomicrobia bacterium]|nr:hypothetical protein [Verrucomicrobiota bacterium]MCH8511693.1 hypothetical protein [Kiritimatiellia bacterium]